MIPEIIKGALLSVVKTDNKTSCLANMDYTLTVFYFQNIHFIFLFISWNFSGQLSQKPRKIELIQTLAEKCKRKSKNDFPIVVCGNLTIVFTTSPPWCIQNLPHYKFTHSSTLLAPRCGLAHTSGSPKPY